MPTSLKAVLAAPLALKAVLAATLPTALALYAVLAASLLSAGGAGAQPFTMPPPGGVQVTAPYGKGSVQTKVTIAVTNTFQTALAANPLRLGCLIQNTGTATLFVFFGAATPGDTTTSLQVTAGGTVNCSTATGGVLTDQVLVTGTAAGTAVVVSQ